MRNVTDRRTDRQTDRMPISICWRAITKWRRSSCRSISWLPPESDRLFLVYFRSCLKIHPKLFLWSCWQTNEPINHARRKHDLVGECALHHDVVSVYVMLALEHEFKGMVVAMQQRKLLDDGQYFLVGVYSKPYDPRDTRVYFEGWHCLLLDGAARCKRRRRLIINFSGRSVFFSSDATAQQRLNRFSQNLHQKTTSLQCYSLVVVS